MVEMTAADDELVAWLLEGDPSRRRSIHPGGARCAGEEFFLRHQLYKSDAPGGGNSWHTLSAGCPPSGTSSC